MQIRFEDEVAMRQNLGILGTQAITEFPFRMPQMSRRSSRDIAPLLYAKLPCGERQEHILSDLEV